MLTQTKFYYYVMCDSGDWSVKLSCRHVVFKFLYVQLLFLRVLCVDYASGCTSTIHHGLCFSPFSRRLYFASQIQRCVVLIIFVWAQRAKAHHRFFLFWFWEATWLQNDLFSDLIIGVIQGMFLRLTSPCLEDGVCGVVANHILSYKFIE